MQQDEGAREVTSHFYSLCPCGLSIFPWDLQLRALSRNESSDGVTRARILFDEPLPIIIGEINGAFENLCPQ